MEKEFEFTFESEDASDDPNAVVMVSSSMMQLININLGHVIKEIKDSHPTEAETLEGILNLLQCQFTAENVIIENQTEGPYTLKVVYSVEGYDPVTQIQHFPTEEEAENMVKEYQRLDALSKKVQRDITRIYPITV